MIIELKSQIKKNLKNHYKTKNKNMKVLKFLLNKY